MQKIISNQEWLFIAVFANLFSPALAYAQNTARPSITAPLIYYVATTGNDSNSCTASGSPCATINGALAKFNAIDPNNNLVTIQISDGSYSLTESDITSPTGQFLDIVGDLANPANVRLNFAAANFGSGFKVSGAGVVNLIDGVTINGNGWTSHGVWTAQPSPYGVAIYAYHGGQVTVGQHVAINKFYYGLRAELSGSIICNNNGIAGPVITEAGDSGIHAFDGGHIECRYVNVSFTGDRSVPLGNGILAENGSSVVVNHAISSHNDLSGFFSLNGSGMWVQGTLSSFNGQYGYHSLAGSMDAGPDGTTSSAASYNGSIGFLAEQGGIIAADKSSVDHTGYNGDNTVKNANADAYLAKGGKIDGNSVVASFNTGFAFHALVLGAISGPINLGASSGNGTNAPAADGTSIVNF